MVGLGMFCHVEVMQHRAGGRDAGRHLIHAEAFERDGPEMVQEFLARRLRMKSPVFERCQVEFLTECALELGLPGTFDQHLTRRKMKEHFFHIGTVAFRRIELARRDVQARKTVQCTLLAH